MSMQTWREVLVAGVADGPTLTLAAAASCIPTGSRIILPNNYFYVGRVLKLTLAGRLSCAITTPGTARFDVRLGPSGTIVAFDTGALTLNSTGKTNVPFRADILLTCRAVGSGTASNLMGNAVLVSEALVAGLVPSAGSNTIQNAPVGAPAVGTGFDNTAANALDVFYTQTVATGSMTLHQYLVESLN